MKAKFNTRRILFTLIISFLMPLPQAIALELGQPSISVNGSYFWETGLDDIDSQAEVAVSQFGTDVAWPFQLTDRTDLMVKFSANRFQFHWENSDDIAFTNGARPWSRLQSAEADLILKYRFNQRWTGFTGLGMGMGWEILNNGGDTLQKFELDNTPGVELKINYIF